MDRSRPRVGLFVTCLVDAMRPNIGFAALRLLEAAGCEVDVPQSQTCCGQPAFNSGADAAAAPIARRTIEAFEGHDYLVAPSGSCAGMIKGHYPELFADDPVWRARAEKLAAKTYELLGFLVDVRGFRPQNIACKASATYHDSCSGLRELGVKAQPRALLAAVEGLEMRPLEDAETCCGFGGTFCVKYSAISNAIVGEKAQNVVASGADLLLGGDLGCLMNMAGKLHRDGARTRVFHAAEILAGMSSAAIGEEGAMSQLTETTFDERVEKALADKHLKIALDRTTGNARVKRAAAVAAWPEFNAARAAAAAIKDHAIAHMGFYLEMFERNAIASGAQVHWASDSEQACTIVVRLCQAAGARTVTRSKSMLGEEIGLPHALEAAGIRRVETDLAEHIIQLAHETPSHIIWPAAHRTREDVARLFAEHHRDKTPTTDIESMVYSARKELREDFFAAEVGISGANYLVADTGAICTITNEGNAELTTTPPRVHIVTAGIEKIVANTEHALQLTRLLVRAATGADLTQYTTFHCGPKRPGDRDGPEEFHIVLVDHGRTKMLADMPEMLRCLRCGACLNHCVVYRNIGGHAYGGAYPGPMGSVLTPVFDGLENSRDLPNACTLNGQCRQVCPVDIPLPTLLRGWRSKSWRGGFEPAKMRGAISLWAFAAAHPALYRLGVAVALPAIRLFAKGGWVKSMPLASGWTAARDLPKPAAQSFMAQYASRKGGK